VWEKKNGTAVVAVTEGGEKKKKKRKREKIGLHRRNRGRQRKESDVVHQHVCPLDGEENQIDQRGGTREKHQKKTGNTTKQNGEGREQERVS